MKFMQTLVTASAVTGSVLFSQAAFAQNTIVFGGSGSSALFNALARAARTANLANNGTYTLRSNNSPNPVVAEAGLNTGGNLWVSWTGSSANNRQIAFYIAVDSTVGVRAYLNSSTLNTSTGAAFLPVPVPGATTNGNAIDIPFFNRTATTPALPVDVSLPPDVEASIKGAVFNAGGTDVTPADAKQATRRSFLLGYGSNATSGAPIPISSSNPAFEPTPSQIAARPRVFSSYGTQNVAILNFNLSSRPFFLQNLGASPVLVFVNRATGSDLAAASVSNVNRFSLAGLYSGQLGQVNDIDPASAASTNPVIVNQRELISGTYITFQNCIPLAFETEPFTQGVGQELNVTTNPLSAVDGQRRRVIGTSQMTSVVNTAANTNHIGYAFWSVGTFVPLTNTKYLTVDGVDPIVANYGGGTYTSDPTFANIQNGSYPIWSVLRLLLPGSPSGALATFVGAINVDDVVPATTLRVFRSFRATPDVSAPSNGVIDPIASPAAGADSGGAVFLINNEINFVNATGGELVNFRQ